MLIWEGGSWLLLLFGGGTTLIYLIWRQREQARKLRLFLATFSHDVKTALTSLRLQTDILREESQTKPPLTALSRLESDVVRLQLQLENSLFLASQGSLPLLVEKLNLKELVDVWRDHWPQLTLELKGNATLIGDRRALESILTNLFQNSRVHGRAKMVTIQVMERDPSFVNIRVIDDGNGFQGNLSKLGRLFERHNPSSGSGIGLYSVVTLIKKMGGQVHFIAHESYSKNKTGFCVEMILPGVIV